MQYPTITFLEAQDFIELKVQGHTRDLGKDVQWKGEGPKIKLNTKEFIKEVSALRAKSFGGKSVSKRDGAKYDSIVINLFSKYFGGVSDEAASDRHFWMYLSIVAENSKLFDIICHRFNKQLGTALPDSEETRKNTSNSLMVHCSVCPTGSAIKEGYYPRCWMIAFVNGATKHESDKSIKSIDWFRSHLLRVEAGSIEKVALVATKISNALSIEQQREFAKFINAKAHIYSFGSTSDEKILTKLFDTFLDQVRRKDSTAS